MKSIKYKAKELLGDIPLLAELDVNIRKSQYPKATFIENLEMWLPKWVEDYQNAPDQIPVSNPQNIFIFSGTQRWNPHTILLSMLYKKIGHKVDFGFAPYRKWYTAQTKYDTRKMNHYLKGVLKNIDSIINTIPFYDINSDNDIPDKLNEKIFQLSIRDCQYTYQMEDVSEDDPLFRLRIERNTQIMKSFFSYLETNSPDIVILPNGMVFEFGAIFECCSYLNIPVTTYEFGEQQERIWLDQTVSVMLQNTTDMWNQIKDTPFNQNQNDALEKLYANRRGGNTHNNFSRKWQSLPQQGEEKVKNDLSLDNRPIILLAANVIGDSLTLGRQVFSTTMTDWILKTIEYLIPFSEIQLLVRIHPGEKSMSGPSVSEAIFDRFQDLPEHIHIILAEDSINTYDVINFTDLGLTYTTTVGMEMAMGNIPVIVSGNTHYGSKGFTYNPNSWDSYFNLLNDFISNKSINAFENQVETSKKYAFHFFFTYPHLFPWHLGNLENDFENINFSNIFESENWDKYEQSFKYILGEKINWDKII